MTSSELTLKNEKRLVYWYVEECWNEGNRNRVPVMVAAHCAHHDSVFPFMPAGVETLQEHIDRCRRAFPDLKIGIFDTVAEENEVAVRWTATGTQRGDFLGIPATHREVSIRGISIFRIEELMIVEQWTDWNLMSLLEQLEVATAPAEVVGAAC